jgi:myo-inositol 2-dehydrogenase/D-chiro-inositol 1-dehydrogenase
MSEPTSRRDFLKTSSAVALGTALGGLPAVHAAGSDVIKVGVIGCGGRGSGAADDGLKSAKGVEVIALGDYFKDRVDGLRNRLNTEVKEDAKIKELGNKVDVPEDRCFVGIDAAERVINTSGVNYIILATPPGFRPVHLQAAIAAGKHVFTEKPVSVDGPGTRKCLDVFEEANKKKLGIAAGTQRRHQLGYIETIKQLHDGAIGDVLSLRCYWNNRNDIWFRARKNGMTDLDYQVHNWYHFLWLCGDHIAEQHVHNLDVCNWIMKTHPIRCLGMGGRVAPCADPSVDGNKYNFFAVEFEYPNGVRMHSQCRQINNVDDNVGGVSGVSEAAVGTKGLCQVNTYTINGKPVMTRQQDRKSTNPYVQEHTDLIESIRAGKPINELKNVAESSLTAVMGRMSAYTGKAVSWDQALNSRQDTMPATLSRDMTLVTPPVAVPGKTELV